MFKVLETNSTSRTDEKIELVDFSNSDTKDIDLLNNKNKQIVTWGISSLGLTKYQSTNRIDRKIKVAILDSGINKGHEDLKGKVIKEFNAINPKEKVRDDFGHGTAIAGVIAAENNKVGIVGVNPDVDIYSVKVLDKKGKGDVKSLIKGIKWSIKNKVQVINISFGMPSDHPELHKIITEAISSGIIVVAASGNNYGMNVDYPAKYKDVISVTAVNKNYKTKPVYSAKGKIDFALPGDSILTTSWNGQYEEYKGSSFAAAYMTGLVSLILENSNEFKLDREKEHLTNSVIKILKDHSIKLGDQKVYGNGFVKLS